MIAVEYPLRTYDASYIVRPRRVGLGKYLSYSLPAPLSSRSSGLDFNVADEPFQYPGRFYRIAKKESDYCSLPYACSLALSLSLS